MNYTTHCAQPTHLSNKMETHPRLPATMSISIYVCQRSERKFENKNIELKNNWERTDSWKILIPPMFIANLSQSSSLIVVDHIFHSIRNPIRYAFVENQHIRWIDSVHSENLITIVQFDELHKKKNKRNFFCVVQVWSRFLLEKWNQSSNKIGHNVFGVVTFPIKLET